MNPKKITCHAAIAPMLASAIFYSTFADAVRKACELFGYPDARTLFSAVCEDVWRECLRRNDMRAWELFKMHVNHYCHATGELSEDRVFTFMWAGSIM